MCARVAKEREEGRKRLRTLFFTEGSIMYTKTVYWAKVDREHGIIDLNTCEGIGNGKMVYGTCVCNEGWRGEKCDIEEEEEADAGTIQD